MRTTTQQAKNNQVIGRNFDTVGCRRAHLTRPPGFPSNRLDHGLRSAINNLKVVALGQRVPHKANYWLSSKNGKLLMTKNAMLLKQHRLDIFNNLCEDLEDL